MSIIPNIRNVQIQTHSRCNANCLFCPWVESEHNTVNRGTMTNESWQLVLDRLLPFADGINSGKVCPYLMNEPLIDRSIFEKINDIYQRFPKTCVEVSTNGAALTEKVIDQLFAAFEGRNHELWVSHHGIDAESLEHIMAINYEKTTSNLLNLLRKSNGRFKIRIRGAGESRDRRRVLFNREQYINYWEKMRVEHGFNTRNVELDAFTFHDRAGTLHRTDRGANLLNLGNVRQIGPGRPFHCVRVDEWVHIMWDGRIRLCCMDYHGEVKLPNLHDVTLVDYFQSDAYRQLRGMVTGAIESPFNFICKRCISPGG